MAKGKTTPFEFLQQVRQEGSKVTWPTRKETMVTTGMVFVMVLLAALFFLVVDQILRFGVGLVLGLGG
ncbi:preprotein translocase subunit SecE [Salinarimonas sp.]|jgi:preprotein translocase subunit SecE|uniref:preprotein translocase subunit SecE n=1 Tax=Salinarimonas sp. TaxID=2766526 RepID=UPI0032D8CF11